ncbi:hypothetical protein CORT_0B08230 [Candida orthopsilosis Co 90-125]|uniref:Uncharacterized protein n=1 Tax=Candida orthopsilosis (strain 90-125) TaxID=1136231 RepID=H8X1X2_CANO9|nr:hypothetical protein CORT_0B08230 [Candida orthopsilosis Co 90-125]CCG22528.1 hypothetical protein CORT_0B08230 [Candida orthopsilosis Co 90-125]
MSTDKVEIYTQPPQQDQRSDSIEESIATKLEELIEKHPILPEEALEGDGDENEEEREVRIHQQQERAKEDIERSQYTTHSEIAHKEVSDFEPETESEQEEEAEGDVEVDHDGMEVPQGKIPLDGQFSTDELKKLVEVAQEKGILSEDVDLKVVDSGEIGDRIRLADAKADEEKKKEKEKEDEKEKEKGEGESNKEAEGQ